MFYAVDVLCEVCIPTRSTVMMKIKTTEVSKSKTMHSTIRDLERTFRIFPQIFFYQDHIIGQSGTCQKYRMY